MVKDVKISLPAPSANV